MQILLPDERWTQVEALFQETADLHPDVREAYLDRRCVGDPWLREEVLSLLRYDLPEESALLEALQASAASAVQDEPAAGRMLGPYRIEREIGRGGMSVVYSSLRADGEFQKRVAIKLIKRGMDTSAVIARLRRERRILAALEHPSIARLLDGGTTADGLPWIAMEYVDGVPIHRYCTQLKLTIDEICRLFDKVCDAVAYAHRNLVVHCDLKPSNILIAPDGRPKLLDFGIASLLGGEGDGPDGPVTRGFARPLTPEYASPEQIRGGGAVGTSADIYALGVILYELLAGRRPERLQGKNDVVKASEASLQSGHDTRRSRKLAGDPDNILAMALREDPDRRYLAVEQLQADLRRYLTGMPVAACPETWRYRFGKFLGRHPVGVPAAVAIALAAVVAIVLVVRAETDAAVERARSDQRLGQLVALANTALFDLHGAIESLPGATQARLEIVQKTLVSLDKLNTGAENGSDVRVLTALASAYSRIARVQGSPLQPNLGDLRGAEQSYLKAEKILTTVRTRADSADLQLQDGELRADYGALLAETGRQDQALEQYALSLGEASAVLAHDPRNRRGRNLRERADLNRGQITKYKDPPGTRRLDLEELPEFEAMAREYPDDTDVLLNLASLWSQIGATFDEEKRPGDAVDGFRRSAALREQIITLRPQDVQVQRDLLISYGHLGDLTGSPLVVNMGDYNGAVVWYRKAADIAERMAVADPSNAQARNDEGTAYSRIGVSETAGANYRAALEDLKRAESLLVPLRTAAPESIFLAQRVATIYQYKGLALASLGDFEGATEAVRHSEAICREVLRNHADTSTLHLLLIDQNQHASALTSAGHAEEGLREAQDALESALHSGSNSPLAGSYVPRALAANGAVHSILAKREAGADGTADWRMAADFYRRALSEWQKFPGHSNQPFLGEIRTTEAGLAEAERRLRSYGDAERP